MPSRGFISVIHGPMFSGKTEELLRRIRRARVARKQCRLFKPDRDRRYSPDRVLPHSLAHAGRTSDLGEAALSVAAARDILQHIAGTPEVNLVGIEEAQFFDAQLFDVVETLSARGIAVVLSLLDQDFRRRPFPIAAEGGTEQRNVGDFLAIAHESLKLTAVCVCCGRDAQHSQKLVFAGTDESGEPRYEPASFHEEVVAVGTGRDLHIESPEHPKFVYEARCLECHELPDEPGTDSRARDGLASEGEEVVLEDADDWNQPPERNEPAASPSPQPPRPQAGDLPDLLELAD